MFAGALGAAWSAILQKAGLFGGRASVALAAILAPLAGGVALYCYRNWRSIADPRDAQPGLVASGLALVVLLVQISDWVAFAVRPRSAMTPGLRRAFVATVSLLVLAFLGGRLKVGRGDWAHERPEGAPKPAGERTGNPFGARAGINVVLVLVDTLRADHLRSYGYARETSPFSDFLASRGARFDQAVAQATRTSPSMASLLTGVSPYTHGIVEARSRLDERFSTWAEVLQEHGYYTWAALANPNMGHVFGFTQGLDEVHALFGDEEGRADRLVAVTEAWLRESRREPFFLMVAPGRPASPVRSARTVRDHVRR